MMVCHWMSHWTPQLASTFAPTNPQSAARRQASDAPPARASASAPGIAAAFEPIATRLLYSVAPGAGNAAEPSGLA